MESSPFFRISTFDALDKKVYLHQKISSLKATKQIESWSSKGSKITPNMRNKQLNLNFIFPKTLKLETN